MPFDPVQVFTAIGVVGLAALAIGVAAKRVQGAVTKMGDLIVSAADDIRRVRRALGPEEPPKRIRSRKTGEGGDG